MTVWPNSDDDGLHLGNLSLTSLLFKNKIENKLFEKYQLEITHVYY